MTSDSTASPVNIFVISPIGMDGSDTRTRADQLLRYVIREALPEPDYKVKRADEEDASDSITPRIVRAIVDADLVIADLTDHNPNVFYELAIAHGLQKPVVHVASDGQTPPFDIQDIRVLSYGLDLPSAASAKASIKAAAEHALANPMDLHNPLTGAERFVALRREGGAARGPGDLIAETLEQILSSLNRLERRSSGSTAPDSDARKEALVEGIAALREATAVAAERIRSLERTRAELSAAERHAPAGHPRLDELRHSEVAVAAEVAVAVDRAEHAGSRVAVLAGSLGTSSPSHIRALADAALRELRLLQGDYATAAAPGPAPSFPGQYTRVAPPAAADLPLADETPAAPEPGPDDSPR